MSFIQPQTLFGEMDLTPAERKESQIAERHRRAKLAYASTADAWKRATYDFAVNVFLPTHSRFLFEEISLEYAEYAKRHRKPATVNGKAFAGLQSRLIKEGLIEQTADTGTRSNGQIGNFYMRVENR